MGDQAIAMPDLYREKCRPISMFQATYVETGLVLGTL
jgi:hypothetical protein